MENKNSVVLVAMLLGVVVGALSFYEEEGESQSATEQATEHVLLYETELDWQELSDLDSSRMDFEEGVELDAYTPQSTNEVQDYVTAKLFDEPPARLAPAVRKNAESRPLWYESYQKMRLTDNLEGIPTRFAPAKDSDDLVTGSAGMTFLYKPKNHREIELKLSDQHLELKMQKSF